MKDENTMILANTKIRILQYLEYKGISKPQFYTDIDIKRGLLDSDKMNSTVVDTVIAKILVIYKEVDPMWLLTGQGFMLRNGQAQPIPLPVVQADSSGEAAIYYKMYKEEKEGKEALIAENATLKERLRQLEAPPVKEPAHPPLIEKLVDAFTQDSLGGSGKDFMRTRNPVPSKTSSASKT